ncbi:MAG: hypothetical protein HOV97_05075 [Nonomuraea sp.]|nr:hypothetical protein [Nonomuraea sp.]
MATPDSTLGLNADFDAANFRNMIKATMQMGAAPDPDKRPKFIRKSTTRTYWKNGVQLAQAPRMGREGEPLDAEIEVRVAAPVVITDADCAVSIERVDADELPVGNFRQTKAVVTLLDVDYAKVDGCKEMTYNGDTYRYGYEPEVNGLFTVAVHTIIWYALDES